MEFPIDRGTTDTIHSSFQNRRSSRSKLLKQTFPGGFAQASKQLNDKIGLFDAINKGSVGGTGNKTFDKNSFVHWSRETMSPTARSRGPDDGNSRTGSNGMEQDAFADMAGPFFCDFTGTEELMTKASITTLEVPPQPQLQHVRSLNYGRRDPQQYIANKRPVYLDFSPMPPMSPTGSRTSLGGGVSSSHSLQQLSQTSGGDSTHSHNSKAQSQTQTQHRHRHREHSQEHEQEQEQERCSSRSAMRSRPLPGFTGPTHHESPTHSPLSGVEQLVDVLGMGSHRKTLERAASFSYRSMVNNSLTRGTSMADMQRGRDNHWSTTQAASAEGVTIASTAAATAAAVDNKVITDGLKTGPARRPSSPLLSTKRAPRPLPGTVRLTLQYELPPPPSSLVDTSGSVSVSARVWHAALSVSLHTPFHEVFATVFQHFYDELYAVVGDVFFDDTDALAADATYQSSLPVPVQNLRQTSRNRAPRYRKDNTFLGGFTEAIVISDPTARVSSGDGALAPAALPLQPRPLPRTRPSTPYSSVTPTNYKLNYYHEGQSAWRELATDKQWETAIFDSVEHEGTLRVLISTPTLATSSSSALRNTYTNHTNSGTGTGTGSPAQILALATSNDDGDAGGDGNSRIGNDNEACTATHSQSLVLSPPAPTGNSNDDNSNSNSRQKLNQKQLGTTAPRVNMNMSINIPAAQHGTPNTSCGGSPVSRYRNTTLVGDGESPLRRTGSWEDSKFWPHNTAFQMSQSNRQLQLPSEVPFTTAALLSSKLPNHEALALSTSQMQLGLQKEEENQEQAPLRLLNVPWLPSKLTSKSARSLTRLREAPTTRINEETLNIVPHNIATISPLNVRANTVIIPRSESVPELKHARLTRPVRNPRRPVINKGGKLHQDDITSRVVPSRRELLLNDNKVEAMIQHLEDQLLQTRWL